MIIIFFFLYGLQGEGINFSPLNKSPEYPLIYAKYANRSGANEDEARYVNMITMPIQEKFQH